MGAKKNRELSHQAKITAILTCSSYCSTYIDTFSSTIFVSWENYVEARIVTEAQAFIFTSLNLKVPILQPTITFLVSHGIRWGYLHEKWDHNHNDRSLLQQL